MATSNQSNRSASAKDGLNLKLDPIETFIFSGLQQRFLEVFEAKSIWVTSSDKAKLLQKLFGTSGSSANDLQVTYPYAFLTLGTVAVAENRQSRKALGLYGLQTAVITDDAKRAYRVKVAPVDFTVSVEFVTNNYQDVLRYVNTWIFARDNGWLKFNIQYGQALASVSLDMDSSLSIPQREADLSNVQDYTVASTLVIQGYMSFPVLMEQQLVDTVVTTTEIGSDVSSATWAF